MKPTHRFIANYVQDYVDSCRLVKRGFNYLAHDVDYREIALNILKPPLSRVVGSTVLGGIAGGIFWSLLELENFMGLVHQYPSFLQPLTSAVLDHPVETAVVGALAGLGVAGYALAFHRPTGS